MSRTPENEQNWIKFEQLMDESEWTSPEAPDLNMSDGDCRHDNDLTEMCEDDLTRNTPLKTLGDRYIDRLTKNIVECAHQAFNLKKEKKKGNLINWKVRKMMKEKRRISNRLLKCKDAKKVTILRKELFEVENDLKEKYDKA